MHCTQNISNPNINLQVKYDRQVVGSFSHCGFPIKFVRWTSFYMSICNLGEENVCTSSCDGYNASVIVLF